jgi:hypothetical protein
MPIYYNTIKNTPKTLINHRLNLHKRIKNNFAQNENKPS